MTKIYGRRRWVGALALIVVLTLFWGMREQAIIRRQRTYHELSGETMGTFYNIKLAYADVSPEKMEHLHEAVVDELEEIERSMSTYLDQSEISRFNRMGKDESLKLGPDFMPVLKLALEICDLTAGAFDPTVGPLIDLWGFGRAGRRDTAPSGEEIAERMRRTGWQNLELSPDGYLSKRVDGLEISLGAIAKGYAADRVARTIQDSGASNFMVEIGGEVYTDGLNSSGSPWKIGIEMPQMSMLASRRLRGVVAISNLAVATSGDYRNYFEGEDGTVYSHIIDPRTGSPVRMPPAGVTVTAADCATADALATALFVLGAEEGLQLVETLDGVEALFIVSNLGGGFRERASSGFVSSTAYSVIGQSNCRQTE